MKFLLFIYLFNISPTKEVVKKCTYSVSIWDYDYSLAKTLFYRINSDSIVIESKGTIEGESDKILIQRQLSDCEERIFCDFLSSFPIDRLSTEYKNALVQDGDQKRIEFSWGGKIKTVYVKNYYQPDIAYLILTINGIIGESFNISYRR